VSELLDYLEALAPVVEDEHAKPYARFVTRHPLQPFSPRYFVAGSGLFSYSIENFQASQPRTRLPASGWADVPLPAPEAEWRQVELRRLIEFFRHPARYFLRRRLGVELPSTPEHGGDCEPLALDDLERWQLTNELTGAILAGRDATEAGARARAAGRLPVEHFGAVALAELPGKAEAAAAQVAELGFGAPIEPLPILLSLGEWQLSGTLENVYEGGQLLVCGANLSPKDRITAWVRHLVLNAADPRGHATVLVDSEEVIRFEPLPDAGALLLDLLEVYGTGLMQPIPFFPRSSFEIASRLLVPGARKAEPFLSARNVFARYECNDPHYAFCFGHLAEPCDDAWRELALRVFAPMLGK
jgi:exodeoxyribonuclease V gamma subunit